MTQVFTGATAGTLAGAQVNDTTYDYALEATFNVAPGGAYQALRATGDTFAKVKSRDRPLEIVSTGEVSQAVTVSEAVSGSLNIALSGGTYDDLLAGSLDNDFQLQYFVTTASGGANAVTVSAVSADPTQATVLTSSGTPFTNWASMGLVRIKGSTGGGAGTATPGVYLYSYVSPSVIYVYPTQPGQTFTTGLLPAGAGFVANLCRNGTKIKTYTVRERIAGAYLQRQGGYVNKASLSFAQGAFASGSFDFMFASQAKNLTSVAASVSPAPTGPVMQMTKGWSGLFIGGQNGAGYAQFTQPTARLRSLSVDLSSDGAAQDYAMGSAAAIGMRGGSLLATGQVQLYFPDYTLYDRFEAEAASTITGVVQDPTGFTYGFTWLNATLQNPKVNATRKNDPVLVTFDVEGNPQAGGGTFQLDSVSL